MYIWKLLKLFVSFSFVNLPNVSGSIGLLYIILPCRKGNYDTEDRDDAYMEQQCDDLGVKRFLLKRIIINYLFFKKKGAKTMRKQQTRWKA